MAKQRMRVTFYECEHNGDLDPILFDLIKSGASIADQRLDTEAEEATVIIEVENESDFMENFKHTDSFSCSSLE